MRHKLPIQIERCRVATGPYASTKDDGMNGAFLIPLRSANLKIISSDGSDWQESGLLGLPWEHVSVSTKDRCPTWDEMDYVKRLFWKDDETVIQFHVPRKDHISYHDFCLSMWRPVGVEIPMPPSICVAPAAQST